MKCKPLSLSRSKRLRNSRRVKNQPHSTWMRSIRQVQQAAGSANQPRRSDEPRGTFLLVGAHGEMQRCILATEWRLHCWWCARSPLQGGSGQPLNLIGPSTLRRAHGSHLSRLDARHHLPPALGGRVISQSQFRGRMLRRVETPIAGLTGMDESRRAQPLRTKRATLKLIRSNQT